MTYSLKQMTLRRKTIDQRVKNIPQSEKVQPISKDSDSKPKTMKNVSLPHKKDKNF